MKVVEADFYNKNADAAADNDDDDYMVKMV